MILVDIVSLLRYDFATAYNISLFLLTIIIIIENQLILNLKLINTLFMFSIFFSILTSYAGVNLYGYIPFQSNDPRISLFPKSVVGSAFFSFFIAILNYFFNKERTRWIFIMTGLYFFAFSGCRTAIICCFFVFLFMFTTKLFSLRHRVFYQVFFFSCIGLFVMSMFFSNYLLLLGDFKTDYFNYFATRDVDKFRSAEDIENSLASFRTVMWQVHYETFKGSPFLFGEPQYNDELFKQYNLSGSESFLTGLLARVGILIIPLIIFFFNMIKKAIVTGNKFIYCILLCIILIMLSYGSFMVPYNFLFLIIFGMITMQVPIKGTDFSLPHPDRAGLAKLDR